MKIAAIIRRLKSKNIALQLHGEQLKLIGETNNLEKEFIAEIKAKKAELISFLKETAGSLHYETIPAAPIASHYELTGAQKQIWIASQFAGGSAAYTIVSSFYMKGVDVQLLQGAFERLMQRHESLRTIFKEVEGEPRQFILDHIPFTIEQEDLSEVKEQVQKLSTEESLLQHSSFVLERGPLFKAKLIKLSNTEHALLLSIHHIISDGWSVGLLIQELMAVYGVNKNKRTSIYPPLTIQYKDYAHWLKKKQTVNNYEKARTYWKTRLQNLPESLAIPSDFARPDIKKQEGAINRFYLHTEQFQAIQLLCKKLSINLFNFLHAAIGIFLYKYTGQWRTIIGTPVSGRQHAELENQLGLYVNTLALLTETDPEKSVDDYLKETAAAATKDFQHQEYPFDQLIDMLTVKREPGRTPLFDVMLVLQDTTVVEKSIRIATENNIEIGFLDKHVYENKSLTKLNRAAKFDLTFDFFVEAEDAIRVEIEYSTELFTQERINSMGNMFSHILSQLLKQPKKKIRQLELLNASEKKKIVHQFNEPIADVNHWQLYDLLKPSFREHKDEIALICGKKRISYKTIDEQSDQLAYYLMSKLPTTGNSFVGIFMERTEWTLISMLGILKAGATYVPIDLNYPAARVEFMLEDADPEFIITDKKGRKIVPAHFKKRIIDLSSEKEAILGFPKQRIYPKDLREKTAYLIYTSGSTGKPKGVEICHRNVIAFLQWAREEFIHTPFDVLYATTSYCFDLSVFEFFFPLLKGKTIRLLNSAMEIVHFLPGDQQVMLNTVPSVVRNLLEEQADFSSVTALNMAGEPVPKKFKQVLPYSQIEIRNLYGPSEDTTYSTCYLFKDDGYDVIPIGKPISNTQLYILDEYLHLLPEGVDGEIYLSGQGLAKGYHELPELTGQKFLPNPFLKGELLYKTGDRGRWLPDGQVVFTGRVDDQVKVRGYRIELGEIQYQLEQITGIEQAIVVVKEIQGDQHIIAYWKGINETNAEELKAALSSQLPAYSLPSFFIQLESIPLNVNGKVDKRSLPLPDGSTLSVSKVPPGNKMEMYLHTLWKQVLPTDSFGVVNNFFELGGHSLNASRLKILIHKELKKEISLQALFQHPTIRQQARFLDKQEESKINSIEKAPHSSSYPLSSTQRRLWVLSQFADGGKAYHMPGVYMMEGKLDVDILTMAFNIVIARHEILRTIFKENEEGVVQQFILPASAFSFALKQMDLQHENNKEEVVKAEVAKEIEACFDLSEGPLMRAAVYQLSADQWILAYVIHHIISDGWSMGIILNEVLELYNAHVEQQIPSSLPILEIQFKDYTIWVQKLLAGEQFVKHKQYWLQQFEGEIPVLNLPSDKKRPIIKTYNGAIYKTQLHKEFTKTLRKFCQEKDGTLFMGLMAMVNAILYRYSNQEDIIIGVPVAGREFQQLENQIGCYVNTLALKSNVKGEENFNTLFEKTKQNTLQAYEYQAYPFDELVDALSLQRDLSRNALFDVMVSLQDNSLNDRLKELKGLNINPYESDWMINSKFDLSFDFTDTREELHLHIEYNTDIFSEAFIHSFIQNFLRMMELLLEQPATAIGQLDILSQAEKQMLLTDFNNTAVDYPKDKTIIDLFEEQVARTPDQIALKFEDKNLTYKELNEQSNQLADFLRKHYKVKPDDLVGIKLDRNEWMIIALLGVLKSGAAYVPVDPMYPQDRISYMISDSQCRVLIDREELEKFKQQQYKYGKANRRSVAKTNNLAYVIYTSGSTGQPKGVMIEHHSLFDYVNTFVNVFTINESDRVIQQSSFSFDTHVEEIYPVLSAGGIILMSKNGGADILELQKLIEEKQATILSTTPQVVSELNKQLPKFPALRLIISGGDVFHASYVSNFLNKIEIYDSYGPSESTVCCTYHKIENGNTTSIIGHPIHNRSLYILNDQQQLVPIGVACEIYIGGAGLARGYLNNPDLTAEKFLTDPFKKGDRLYKTGDLGRWLPDGTVEFIGRKDDQVKIRGYRIELGEIENALSTYSAVETSVVLVKSDQAHNMELVAYVVCNNVLNVSELRQHLIKTLPSYMLPSYYVQLEKMPLTANGKINRKKLPELDGNEISTGVEYVSPRNKTEEGLVLIWEEILGKKKIGIKDNFFEQGGHSLKVTWLSNQIYKKMNVRLDLRDLFKYSFLEEQAVLIEKSIRTSYDKIGVAPKMEFYQASSAQKRLYFLHELSPESTSYNMSMLQYLGKEIDSVKIEKTLIQLINRHESLRTSFRKRDGVVVQIIHPDVSFKLRNHFCTLNELNAYVKSLIIPFDLGKAPLFRSSLVEVKDIGFVWVADMHHIISDGTSVDVLINDFINLYNGNELPDLEIQYKDFTEWQNKNIETGAFQDQKDYWLSQFGQEIPKLNFPTDRIRPSIFSFEGSNFKFTIDKKVASWLYDFGRDNNGTLQMTLLSILNIALHKYTGQDDLIVGCGIAGRRHSDVEKIVGMFVNVIAIRSFPKSNKNFRNFYEEIISTCIAAYENQDVQFEDLVDILKIDRDTSRNPIFDIALVVQNFKRASQGLTELINGTPEQMLDLQYESGTSKFDMTWFVEEENEEIQINIEYYSAIYDHSSIERLVGHFMMILNTIIATPDIQISQIRMLSEQEQQQLLSFNTYADIKGLALAETFHSLFEKQSLLTPDDFAVTDTDKSYTYKELNKRANQLAHFLRTETNIRKEDKIGVLQSRTVELIVSILGILKSGGTYVPLDSKHPEARLLYMLYDAGIGILLTEKKMIEFANRLQWRSKSLKHLICIDSENIYQEEGLWKNDMMRKDLWDHVGSTAEDAISGGGWMSSYTGEYLSEAEMNEYSRNAYLKLKPYLNKTMRVLEIGCSSGLTMFEIAKEVGAYHGTDLSSTIIANTKRVANEKGFINITLSCLPAHEIDQVQGEDFDLVIINSVLQSFHGHNYLRDVLVKAIGKMKTKGLLFIGDIMDEDKREALIQDLFDFKQENRHKAYRTKTDLSSELFISRDYLDDLICDQMGMVHADYSDKIHTIANELTRFRFDALINIDHETGSKGSAKKKEQHDLKKIKACAITDPCSNISATDLAYVIYTSGSTGKPKGVMIAHESIVSFLEGCRNKFSCNGKITIPLLASHAFDISLFETFLPLLTGGCVRMLNEEYVKEIPRLAIELKTVNAFHAVPALMAQIITYIAGANTKQEYEGIQDLFIGGDAVPTNILEEMRVIFPKARIHTLYGPTESTIFITTKHYLTNTENAFKGALLGKPNANAKIYITDNDQNLMPLGAVGEICVSGKTVAKGYLNNPELTAEKFINNPFDESERIYRTGDMGKWNAAGELEFVGRMDSQVKVRGFRIELGEIENNLENQEDVSRAIVLPKKDTDGSNYLVAYVEKKKRVKLTPSLSEYFVYDDIAYHAMTTDEKRNFHYKQAFNRVLKNKVVLDIGTGPDAILSQFAVLAGARKVYAVEILEETYLKAKKRIAELGLENKIILIHGDITKIELPEKAEYCISEIVGAVGGSEGAAKLINEAKRFLIDQSNTLPKRSLTKIAAVYLPDELHQFAFDEVSVYYIKKIFDQVGYKFDLRMCVEHLTSEHVITNHQPFEDLDFTAPIQLEETHAIKLVFEKDCIVNGFVVWLNLYIDEHQLIDTLAERYIWLPVYLPVFYNDTQVKQGDYIEADIERKLASNGLNPDFVISGTLHRQAGESIDFKFISSNTEAAYKGSPFYEKLFENDHIQTREDISATTLRKYLKDKLPEYMIPSAFVLLNEMPLSSNDKLDRKALAKLGTEKIQLNKEWIAPRNKIEEQLAIMWKELLGLEQIGVTDNFFEIGGHSLRVIRLISQIRNIFSVDMQITDVFNNPTIEFIAQEIEREMWASRTINSNHTNTIITI